MDVAVEAEDAHQGLSHVAHYARNATKYRISWVVAVVVGAAAAAAAASAGGGGAAAVDAGSVVDVVVKRERRLGDALTRGAVGDVPLNLTPGTGAGPTSDGLGAIEQYAQQEKNHAQKQRELRIPAVLDCYSSVVQIKAKA